MKRARWTEKADTELRRRIAARQPLATIAKEMGRTIDGVRGRCAMLQLTLPSPTRPWRETVKRGLQPLKPVPPQAEGD
ncbi:hypothetical protein BRX43_18730 [Sphingomonas sp. S-NIH.Pt15_0812]|nr:hypothetical protein BRX43_18730 [Sphingomonas sp. S-NIH.Pt15_0812]